MDYLQQLVVKDDSELQNFAVIVIGIPIFAVERSEGII